MSKNGVGQDDYAVEIAHEIKPRNLITFNAAMAKLGCRRSKVYDLIRKGQLIAYKDGPRTMVDADSIAAYQASLPRLILRAE